jgi:hypothetical protein
MKEKVVILLSLFLVISLFCAVATVSAETAIDFCRRSSENALISCRRASGSDYWLAIGKCNNLSTPAERKACRGQALADNTDRREDCEDQHGARNAVCKRLGKGPYDPVIDPANFVAVINNPFMPLIPGTTFVYEGQTAEGFEHEEFFVTSNTVSILGVTCVEVRDTSTVDGELVEDTLDWFAQDKDGNVWYFGENAKQLAGGLIVGVEGSWTAGVDGAKPGIVMKAKPAVSDFYRQEFSLGVAEDIAKVVSLVESVTVPYGSFTNCLKTEETSPLEPDALENKYYAAGIGQVLTIDLVTGERLELIQITTP